MKTDSIKPYYYNHIKIPKQVIFQANLNLANTVNKEIQGLYRMSEFCRGKFGTQCLGSKPLQNFIDSIGFLEFQLLKNKGLSTNTDGLAYSILKTKADNPVSTSCVRDCSVLYLYNKNSNTHFMYHIFNLNDGKDIVKLIKMCMKEGFTNAAIVPGKNNWVDRHEIYLPDIFRAIKQNYSNASIEVYHYSSYMPEIVGYKGKVYEILNRKQENIGQATFKIEDIRTYTTFAKICSINTLKELNLYKMELKKLNYDEEINKIIYDLINERETVLKKIENCKTQEELMELAQIYDNKKYYWIGNFLNIDKHNYMQAFKRQSYIIAENEFAKKLL